MYSRGKLILRNSKLNLSIMKKIVLMMAIAAFVSTTATTTATSLGTIRVEQKAKPTPEERAKADVKMMTEHIALTADQASRIMPIAVQKYKELRAIRKKHQGNNEATKAETKKLEAKYTAQIKQILSSEQYAKLQAHKAKMRAAKRKKK
jgi:Spy/CpxP family protein refolding chaperone